MKITETEMRGLITGKAMPADIFLGESLAAYLVRKFTNLHTERDALAAENGLAAKAVQTFCDVVGSNTDVIAEEMGIEGAKAILAAMSATGNMPATDAYLNSVRAEGIEILTGRLQQLIDEGVFDAKEIGVAAGAVHEGAQIAAQLRAGKDGE